MLLPCLEGHLVKVIINIVQVEQTHSPILILQQCSQHSACCTNWWKAKFSSWSCLSTSSICSCSLLFASSRLWKRSLLKRKIVRRYEILQTMLACPFQECGLGHGGLVYSFPGTYIFCHKNISATPLKHLFSGETIFPENLTLKLQSTVTSFAIPLTFPVGNVTFFSCIFDCFPHFELFFSRPSCRVSLRSMVSLL